MTPRQISNEKLLAWGLDNIEENTIEQAVRTSRMPFVQGHVALMPDAHLGSGSTVGSVIPTKGAIIPAAIGVDIGCGMIAAQTSLTASQLPDTLAALMYHIEARIPAGIGKSGERTEIFGGDGFKTTIPIPEHSRTNDALPDGIVNKAYKQLGTLGSGNHFLEVCLDDDERVWVVLHSGSRGPGHQLASRHIKVAQKLADQYFIPLEDKALAYLVDGTPQFSDYIADMLWAQDYALANRSVMMTHALKALTDVVSCPIRTPRIINCHHNFTRKEHHHGVNVWVTRKGAIKADADDWGVIPGSMGTSSYIVKGLGNEASYNSCAHGAGRRMSRSKAKKQFTADDLTARMGDRIWNARRAADLIDEIPDSYKDIDAVMAAQDDLVEVQHTLTSIFNYKG